MSPACGADEQKRGKLEQIDGLFVLMLPSRGTEDKGRGKEGRTVKKSGVSVIFNRLSLSLSLARHTVQVLSNDGD
jgi:hypothetical protein